MIARVKDIFIKVFPYDKLLHFMLGTYLTVITTSLMNWWQSLLLTLIVAVCIEIYDKFSKKGTPEIWDIVYTVSGGICVLIINLV